jgi:hypothetical protein
MSELRIITGNFHEKKPATVVKKMAGTPVITGASTLPTFDKTINYLKVQF